MSMSYHPETDGSSEHLNKTVIQAICFHIEQNQTRWVHVLPRIRFNIMNTINKSMRFSPFQLCLGQTPRILPPLLMTNGTIPTSSELSACTHEWQPQTPHQQNYQWKEDTRPWRYQIPCMLGWSVDWPQSSSEPGKPRFNQGSSRSKKKIPRVYVFHKPSWAGLTNYVIRHMSKYGNIMSLLSSLSSLGRHRCLASFTNPVPRQHVSTGHMVLYGYFQVSHVIF